MDRVESKAKRIINCSALTNALDPLSMRRDVGALSLFYWYCSGKMFEGTKTPVHFHLYGVLVAQRVHCLSNSRLIRCGASSFPATSVLWNSLPSSVFPAEFNLKSFKVHVCTHLIICVINLSPPP